MATKSTADADIVAKLVVLEEKRCRALNEQDWPTLESLLSEDYIHTHSSGVVQDKSEYMAYIKASPRITSRGELQVRLYGDAAVMVGSLFLAFQNRDTKISNWIVQVWVKLENAWKTVAFQSTKLSTAAGRGSGNTKPGDHEGW